MVLFCFGGAHMQQQMLTSSLFYSITYAQRWLTTWFCKCDAAGDEHFLFHHKLAWLHCQGSPGLQFLVAACSSEEWKGIAFGALLVHGQCPLCGLEAGDADDT